MLIPCFAALYYALTRQDLTSHSHYTAALYHHVTELDFTNAIPYKTLPNFTLRYPYITPLHTTGPYSALAPQNFTAHCLCRTLLDETEPHHRFTLHGKTQPSPDPTSQCPHGTLLPSLNDTLLLLDYAIRNFAIRHQYTTPRYSTFA